jgi:hypothetical protein
MDAHFIDTQHEQDGGVHEHVGRDDADAVGEVIEQRVEAGKAGRPRIQLD